MNADTRMSSSDPTPEEREMIERMVEFTRKNPHHLPWERLVLLARKGIDPHYSQTEEPDSPR